MGRARRWGSGSGGGAKSTSMFEGILSRHLESLVKKHNNETAEQLVERLRSNYPHYARHKLQPLTKHVHRILQSSRQRTDVFVDDSDDGERKKIPPGKKRKEVDEREERLQLLEAQHMNKRRNGVVVNNSFSSSSATSSFSGSSSSSEDEVSTSQGIKIDLTKSMLRENYCRRSKELRNTEELTQDVELEGVGNKDDKNVNLVNHKGKNIMEIGEEKVGNDISSGNNDGSIDDNAGPMFKDLGGMSDVIEGLQLEVIVPLCHPQLLQHLGVKPVRGILLCGPPGCGKTKLAHAIANESGVPFYKISATELVSGVSGRSEENIRELFSKAYRTAPSILFIDEIDVIASKRENLQKGMEQRIVAQLLICMDESHIPGEQVDRNKDSESSDSKPDYVLVIGATNRPDALDPALRRPGRFDYEIALGVPDESARIEILSVLQKNLNLEDSFDLVKIAKSTPGFVGADLAAVTNKAGILALKRSLNERKFLFSSESLDREIGNDWLRCSWSNEEVEKLKITMTDFEEAVKMVQPSSKREGFSAVPNVKWDDVGGLHSLREKFDRYIIKRIMYPAVYEHFGLDLASGFLLYGPPGCGKTLIAKAVANEAGASFIHIKGPELLNKYVGESESALRTIFSRARTCSPCILFFDEVDALTTNRNEDGGQVVKNLVNQLLLELDGGEKRQGVYVIGATNRPEAMDRALFRPGRFDKLLYVPLPSPEERGMILRALARNKPIDVNVDLEAIGKDSACENFSGADLYGLMCEASLDALWDTSMPSSCGNSDASLRTIRDTHFKNALKKIIPSVSNEQRLYFQLLSEKLEKLSSTS